MHVTPASMQARCRAPTGSRSQMTWMRRLAPASEAQGYCCQDADRSENPSTQKPPSPGSGCEASGRCAKQPGHVGSQPGSRACSEVYPLAVVSKPRPTQKAPASIAPTTAASSCSLAKVTTWAAPPVHLVLMASMSDTAPGGTS